MVPHGIGPTTIESTNGYFGRAVDINGAGDIIIVEVKTLVNMEQNVVL